VAFKLSERAIVASQKPNVEPQLILEIEGVSTVYGAIAVKRFLRYGDDVEYGDSGLVYGGFIEEEDSESFISFDSGTSTTIRQTLDPDKGRGVTVSSLQIALIDKDQKITKLITPGEIVADILGRKARVWFGFADTAYPQDFFILHRGIIDTIQSDAGAVLLTIAHPESKKRQSLWDKKDTLLDGSIGSGDTTITVDDATEFFAPVAGPDASFDSSIIYGLRISNEVMTYTGKTGTTFTGVTRGVLGTSAVAHSNNENVEAFVQLEGNAVDLALKVMFSGSNGNWVSGVDVTNFNRIDATTLISNTIFFDAIDIEEIYGLVVGDYVTTIAAASGSNNVTNKEIIGINVLDDGSYLTIDGVSFVEEIGTSATVGFRSQYDTLGEGLALGADEVDVEQHLFVQRSFVPSFNYLFYIKDTIDNAKEFIENQLYKPFSGFSIPRKSKNSIGIHSAPIPTQDTKIITKDRAKRPAQLKLSRSINKNFENTVIYKFEDQPLEDRTIRGLLKTDATSLGQIPVGQKSTIIPALGMRTAKGADTLIDQAQTRRLNRYSLGAESYDISIFMKSGFNAEIGDMVVIDGDGLQMSDTDTGLRGRPAEILEIKNKVFNVRTGNVVLSVIATGFAGSSRFAVIGPSSRIAAGISTTSFTIEAFYGSGRFGTNEFFKWDKFTDPEVRIHNADFSNDATATLTGIAGNTFTVDVSLGFTPAAGDIIELAKYSTPNTAQVKLLYAWMIDAATFADGGSQYGMF